MHQCLLLSAISRIITMKKIKNYFTRNFLKGLNIILSVMFVVSVAFVSLPQQKVVAATPFGGMSTNVFYCTCTGNIAVTINDLTISPPVGEPLIFQPGSTRLYPYGQIYSSGVWTLGLWQSGGVCLYISGNDCDLYPTAGTMSIVGTSM